ncbi:hypothetical protein LSUB1_G006736 [Lachnellula subtilissima]|uniref:Methyltransferase domain-containing protein n=1 Tax=Lachnellula subtilissima TaxID=602034 RepID=A0A8H8RG48_9HELO|nr:hypothetical protein LSUB1_G006736 [Lachnellula subtilissima]
MAVRMGQVIGVWFWVAFTFFIFVVLNQTRGFLPLGISTNTSTTTASSTPPQTAWPLHPPTNGTLRILVALLCLPPPRHGHRAPRTPASTLLPRADPRPVRPRVGRLGDGGKWVCGMSLYEAKPAPAISRSSSQQGSSETIIYSFGVNDESTFEAEMLARIPSAHIFAYDYSVTSFGPQLSPSYSARAHFKQLGLGAKDELYRTPQFFSLASLMAQNKHSYIDILKIDIEGSEYAALDAFMDECDKTGVFPIGQVMIELHLVDDQHVNFETFGKWWERLEAFGMRPTWLEVNLLSVTLGQGKTDPRCVEYVWVNAKDEKSVLLME